MRRAECLGQGRGLTDRGAETSGRFFNASGAEVCLQAQCFLFLTCLRIKSECVRGDGFPISYFLSSRRRRTYFSDAAREDVKLVEVKARTDWLWLNLGGVA